MPTAWAPLIRAIWPTTEPTAPEAAATTTVSPAAGLPRHSEDAECGLNWCSRWFDLLQAGTIGQSMGLPAGTAYNDIALGEPGARAWTIRSRGRSSLSVYNRAVRMGSSMGERTA
jgi:hypothetical protein